MEAIEAIESYQVATYDEFSKDTKSQDAIFYNLIIIGEAANQLSESLKEKYYQIPWSAMIGTRNVIVHGYDQVKLQIVWGILLRDLKELKAKVSIILNEIR